MAAITKYTPGLTSLLPGPGEQLPDGYLADVALTAGDVVYLKSDGEIAKALATDGTAATDRAIGIIPADYAAGRPVTVHCGGVSYAYAEPGTLTPGIPVFLSSAVAGGLNTTQVHDDQLSCGYVERDGGSIRFFEFRPSGIELP